MTTGVRWLEERRMSVQASFLEVLANGDSPRVRGRPTGKTNDASQRIKNMKPCISKMKTIAAKLIKTAIAQGAPRRADAPINETTPQMTIAPIIERSENWGASIR